MRESLTVLAMVLIVVLTTALVGPYFVDWNAHRAEVERRLSALLGADVAVTGPIDVKLLPRPIFRLQDVAVSGRAPREGRARAARVDMELSLTALLRGEFSFVDADITAPTLTLPLGPDGSILLPRLGADAADRISLVHVALREGTLLLRDQNGRDAVQVGGIAGDGEAESLAGPFKFAGQVDSSRGALSLHLATGALDNGRLRLKIGIDASDAAPKTDIDGFATLAAGSGGTALSLDGTFAANGALPLGGTTDVVPWRLTTTIHIEPGHVALTDGELRAGADGRALIASLSGDIDLGPMASARIALHGRQADLGRLAVAPDADAAVPPDPATPPRGADALAPLAALAGNADLTTALPLPITLDYGIDTILAGSLTLGNLGGHVVLAPGAPLAGTLSIAAADGSHLAADGTFEPGPSAVYKGHIEAASAHLQRLADSVDGDFPAAAAAIRKALPVDAFSVTGSVDLSGVGIAAHDLALGLDRSRFAGTITLTRNVGQDRARLFADLTSDALDIDALPDWRDAARAASDLDVSLALVARATRLASGDTGSVNAGRVALQLHKAGHVTTLDRLSLADIGGATAEIKGRGDGGSVHAEGRLDAQHLHDLFALLDRLAPDLVTDDLLARADALSPALLTIAADAALGADGALAPMLLTVDGTAAGTTIAFHLHPNGTARAATGGAQAPFALDLMLDAPDSGALLRQIGLPTAPTTAVGHGRIGLAARRDLQGALSGTLTAALGATAIAASGRQTGDGTTATTSLKGPNVAPLARALLLAAPDAGAVWPVDAAATLTLRDRRLTADGLTGHLLGTAFGGTLGLVLRPASSPGEGAPSTDLPTLTGALTIDRLPLTLLAALVLGPVPAPRPGAVWPDAAFGPALLALPRSEIALTIGTLPLNDGLLARNAKATLRLGGGALTLADLAARLKDGSIEGTTTLRRDGATASLSGHIGWSDLPVASPAIGGLSRGALDLAGSGNGVGAIMGSLAGSGTIGIADARLPRFDPTAITRVIAGADATATTIDAGAIADTLAQELDHGALSLGTVTVPVTVAAGVLRSEPVAMPGAIVQAEASGTLDLRSFLLSLKATATLRPPPKDWTDSPPQIGIVWKGPFASPAREVDAAALVNGIAARAIARDQARIEAFQDDIRERAFFARRLRSIEAEEQAARDKAKAEADAAERDRMQQLIQAIPLMLAPAAPPIVAPDAGRAPLPPRRPTAPPKPLDLHRPPGAKP